jgi:hypothetical protein
MRSIWLRLTVELGSVNRRGALPRPFRPAGFATTASTLTGPVFEYRRHQSSSATAGPKLHEHEFGGIRGHDHQGTYNPC